MKFPLELAIILWSVLACADTNCIISDQNDNIPTLWMDMKAECIRPMREQIQTEITASYIYLEMGAYFSRDTVNRPAFSEFFFNTAKEQREHAIELMEYLTVRGEFTHHITDLISVPGIISGTKWTGVSALLAALELETKVAEQIRKVIIKCETGSRNDYHLINYLTGVHLEQKYKRQRDIAGKLSTLKKMNKAQGSLSESLYDWHFCIFNCEGSTFTYNPQK